MPKSRKRKVLNAAKSIHPHEQNHFQCTLDCKAKKPTHAYCRSKSCLEGDGTEESKPTEAADPDSE